MASITRADWRETEMQRRSIATKLHRAAAMDLALDPILWNLVPTDGLIRDLLALRHSSEVPSVHISNAAAKLALAAVLIEMDRRNGSSELSWSKASISEALSGFGKTAPDLFPNSLATLGSSLPGLEAQRRCLPELSDDELARLAGTVIESGKNCFWIFGSSASEPLRREYPWVAKQTGCFFTPAFVADYLASRALADDATSILDPATGAGSLLISAFRVLESRHGPDDASRMIHGVEADAELAQLTSMVISFLAGQPVASHSEVVESRIRVGDALLSTLRGPDSWSAWFPEVFESGGFDAAVMNPPFGQMKANRSTLPARSHDNDAAKNVREQALEHARKTAGTLSASLRSHSDYEFAKSGTPDLPRFFVERTLSLLSSTGRLSAIVPSSFLGDYRSMKLRKHLLEDRSLLEISHIPENARLFWGVNQATSIFVATSRPQSSSISIRREVRSPEDLNEDFEAILSLDLLERVDPKALRIPFCSQEQLKVLEIMHQHPTLGELSWAVNSRGELDLTNHKDYVRESRTSTRLVRGDQIGKFNDRLISEKACWVASDFLKQEVSPAKAAFFEKQRIAIPQCSYLGKAERIAAALIPPGVIVANSCNFISVSAPVEGLTESELLLYLTAVLNSEVINWRFGITNSTNHVGNYELDSLPVPDPALCDPGVFQRIVVAAVTLRTVPKDPASEIELESAVRQAFGLRANP